MSCSSDCSTQACTLPSNLLKALKSFCWYCHVRGVGAVPHAIALQEQGHGHLSKRTHFHRTSSSDHSTAASSHSTILHCHHLEAEHWNPVSLEVDQVVHEPDHEKHWSFHDVVVAVRTAQDRQLDLPWAPHFQHAPRTPGATHIGKSSTSSCKAFRR